MPKYTTNFCYFNYTSPSFEILETDTREYFEWENNLTSLIIGIY